MNKKEVYLHKVEEASNHAFWIASAFKLTEAQARKHSARHFGVKPEHVSIKSNLKSRMKVR